MTDVQDDLGGVCFEAENIVDWGDVQVSFAEAGGFKSFVVRSDALAGPTGVALGATVADLRDVFGGEVDVEMRDFAFGDPEPQWRVGASFELPRDEAVLSGPVSGLSDSDVTVGAIVGESPGWSPGCPG